MFWKQKKTKTIQISYPYEERRNSFRIKPGADNGKVIINISGKSYHPENISAGGVSIDVDLDIASEQHTLEIILTIEGFVQSVKINALIIQSQKTLRLSFPDLKEEIRDQIHLYVLELQKKQLRENKGR